MADCILRRIYKNLKMLVDKLYCKNRNIMLKYCDDSSCKLEVQDDRS